MFFLFCLHIRQLKAFYEREYVSIFQHRFFWGDLGMYASLVHREKHRQVYSWAFSTMCQYSNVVFLSVADYVVREVSHIFFSEKTFVKSDSLTLA